MITINKNCFQNILQCITMDKKRQPYSFVLISLLFLNIANGFKISIERNKRYLAFPDGLGNKIQVMLASFTTSLILPVA